MRRSSRGSAGAFGGGSVGARHLHAAVGPVPAAGRSPRRVVVALRGLSPPLRVALLVRLVAVRLLRPIALLHHLLHLLGHALHAALQSSSASLRVHGRAVLTLPEGPRPRASPAQGPTALLALHAHAAHPPLEVLQTFPQGLLALAEAALTGLLALALFAVFRLLLSLLSLLSLLPPLPLLALALLTALTLPLLAVAVALLHAPVLPVAEGIVAELLLLGSCSPGPAWPGSSPATSDPSCGCPAGRSEGFPGCCAARREVLRFRHAAAAHGLFHLLEHPVEIVLRYRPVGA